MIKRLINKFLNKDQVNQNSFVAEGFTVHRGMNGLFALKNEQGELVTEHAYKEIGVLKNEVIKVKAKNNLYGYINKFGKEVVTPQFVYARDFHCGRAVVGDEKTVGLINRKGTFVLPQVFNSINIEEGVAFAQNAKGWMVYDIFGNPLEENEQMRFSIPPLSPMVVYLRGMGGSRTYSIIRLEYDYLMARNKNFAQACYDVKVQQDRYILDKTQSTMDAEKYKKYREEKEEELKVFKESIL